jgi:xylan 1,4-beta-xylosidase
MELIKNPVLAGFNPDPSILRVKEDYYIATSTFEWFPGVQIHHSRDLIHWRLLTRPLTRTSQLDMMGNPSSGGVWAPCLSYSQGVFYLVYTNTKSFKGIFKDTHNYLVTSGNICGEWSEPVYLHSRGFDPSLFHDEDGRKWLVSMQWDFRNGRNRFGGIQLQEYSAAEKKLTGNSRNIFKGSSLGLTEGPHLYKKDGFYYLMTAEGGTSYDHAVTLARSRSIEGPYEVCPDNPILTSKGNDDLKLQKAGHASLVETQQGEWYMAHLCARPLPCVKRCILGRETALQKVVWTEGGWLRLETGGNEPCEHVTAPGLPIKEWATEPLKDHFDSKTLNIHFQTLRIPLGEDMLSLVERPGFLRLKGRESLSSLFKQSLVARRQQSFSYAASTCMEYEPCDIQQAAGLICIYDTMNFYYLHATFNENRGKCLNILVCSNNSFDYPIGDGIGIEGLERVYLKVVVDFSRLQFSFSKDESEWIEIGPVFDASTMSDEYYGSIMEERFTGAFTGICCQDLTGQGLHADFDYFEYVEEK